MEKTDTDLSWVFQHLLFAVLIISAPNQQMLDDVNHIMKARAAAVILIKNLNFSLP